MENSNDDTKTFKIRPAGRHIFTIGKELVQDPITALIEVVKNSYDADASKVSISFVESHSELNIIIKDDGHGMSYTDVTEKWIVPSTDNKIDRKKSPKGRALQGRKGIGRFAVSILGETLLLETIDAKYKHKTSLLIDWNEFSKKDYLDQVELIIEHEKNTNLPKGTTLTITTPVHPTNSFYSYWSTKSFESLIKELKKLRTYSSKDIQLTENTNRKYTSDEFPFNIKIATKNFINSENIEEVITPFPLFELYDYRITGTFKILDKPISDTLSNEKKEDYIYGQLNLVYTCQKGEIKTEETIKKIIDEKGNNCGNLNFDIRVYDRDPSSIDTLISRGLRDDQGKFVGKNEAKRILNENNGIGVFRHGFRIRPLGDPNFDWLELNKQRIQNPSFKIGSDQVIGAVNIEVEEKSNLTEKTARDGLTDNTHYQTLIWLTKKVIGELETRRWNYRQSIGFESQTVKIQRELKKLFSTEKLESAIEKKLKNNVTSDVIKEVLQFVQEDSKKRHKTFEQVEKTLAIYEGQATVGKIVQHIIHEGRQPLAYFRNEAPRVKAKAKKMFESKNLDEETEYYNELEDIADGIVFNTKNLGDLFKRIDPLATGHRGRPKKYNLYKLLERSMSFFSNDINKQKITFDMDDLLGLELNGYEQDIISLFINLIDNSVYWMVNSNSVSKKITINCIKNSDGLIESIDYRDTGPGLDPVTIKNELIFEPHYSTKPNGVGIGLAIAGEMAERLGFTLKALESSSGAYFRLENKKGFQDEQ